MEIPKEGMWTFKNDSIAENFDKHVKEQLPWYQLATNIVVHIVRHYLPENGLLYDIGASTGNITDKLRNLLKHRNATAISIDNSESMKAKFQGYGEFIYADAESFHYHAFDCAVLFLTTMFIPVSKREALISRLYKKMNKGGCLIVFDKTLPTGGYLSIVNSRLALAEKLNQGATPEAIISKELSLSGVQRPIDRNLFKFENCIFKYGDFVGFVLEK